MKLREGPWSKEPDELIFVDGTTLLECKIVRGGLGHLCGYVAVPKDHPWYGVGYNDISQASGDYVEVHGGLTFSGKLTLKTKKWWVGFDCAHLGDLVPAARLADHGDWDETYRDIGYVTNELVNLARQAKEVADAD